jgi:hypothetical protein
VWALRFVVLVLAAGCGRIAFDPLGGGSASGDGGGGSGDAAFGCPAIPQCPDRTAQVGTTSTLFASVTTDHGLSSSMCSVGSNSPELAVLFTPERDGSFTIDASPPSVSVYAQDSCCGGRELACGSNPITVQRRIGEQFVVVVEAPIGTTVSIQIMLD